MQAFVGGSLCPPSKQPAKDSNKLYCFPTLSASPETSRVVDTLMRFSNLRYSNFLTGASVPSWALVAKGEPAHGSDFGVGDFLPRMRMKFCHYSKSSPFRPLTLGDCLQGAERGSLILKICFKLLTDKSESVISFLFSQTPQEHNPFSDYF